MKNAHHRLGTLRFAKRLKDTSIDVTVYMDRFIGEAGESKSAPAAGHFVSVFGGDQDIASVWSCIGEDSLFTVQGPGLRPLTARLGRDAQCLRGSVAVAGRKRAVRHLVALSAEYAEANGAANRTILCNDSPTFVLYRLARRFGLPVAPQWTAWFMAELKRHGAVTPLIGLGCSPVSVAGTKDEFMDWIGTALKRDIIRIPDENGALDWRPACNFFSLPAE